MDIKSLHAIITIVEFGSLSKAADELLLTQPTLSRIVSRIESRLKTELFDRTKTPWVLTKAGDLYLKKAKKIIAVEAEFIKELNYVNSSRKKRLNIGILAFEEKTLLPKVLPIFHERYPDVLVESIVGVPKDVERFISKNVVDFSIVVLPIVAEDIECIPIKTYEVLLAMPSNHPIVRNYKYKKKTELSEMKLSLLKDESWIFLKEDFMLRTTTISVCEKAGFTPIISAEVSNIESLQALIDTGNVVAFTLKNVDSNQLTNEKVSYFKIKEEKIKQTIAFAYKKDKKLNQMEQDFCEILKNNM